MRVAKAEAERFHERFKDAGIQRKTEDLLDGVGDAGKRISEVFSNIKFRSPWFGGGGDTSPSNGASLNRAPLATYLAGPVDVPPPVPVPGHPAPGAASGASAYPPLQPNAPPLNRQCSPSAASTAPPVRQRSAPPAAAMAALPPGTALTASSSAAPTATAAARAPAAPPVASLPPTPLASTTSEDDVAMRHHFAALERLVAMGLTPQAARAALRHFDEWLTSQEGTTTMAGAEASAREMGESILHIGDHVRLEGLVKNAAVNGKMAVLQAYAAENQRWKVTLNDGKSYLLQPKFLHPIAVKPTAYLTQLEEAKAAAENSPQEGTTTASTSEASAPRSAEEERLKAEENAVREQQAENLRKQEEELLRRADDLARTEEMLAAQREEVTRSRASLAMVQAHVANMIEKSESGGEPKTHRFSLVDDEMGEVWNTNEDADDCCSDASGDHESASDDEAENEDVWDMDWSAMASPSPKDVSPARPADDPEAASPLRQPHFDEASASTTFSPGSSVATAETLDMAAAAPSMDEERQRSGEDFMESERPKDEEQQNDDEEEAF